MCLPSKECLLIGNQVLSCGGILVGVFRMIGQNSKKSESEGCGAGFTVLWVCPDD